MVCDLTSDCLSVVSAFLDYQDGPVEVNGSVTGKLRSGPLVNLSACGNTVVSCASDVRVYCADGVLRTTVWGDSLQLLRGQPPGWCLTGTSRDEGWETVPVEEDHGIWGTFLRASAGHIPNPSPPEHGLRMSELWEAIKESGYRGGAPIRIPT